MYCIKCGKESHKTEGNCDFCGEPLVSHDLNHDETRTLNQALHTRNNKSSEKVNSAMVRIVLGSTFLIIGILFFVLSFKYETATSQIKTLNFTCFEFYVALAGLGVGAVLLIWGLISLIYEKVVVQKEINSALDAVQTGVYVHMSENSLENYVGKGEGQSTADAAPTIELSRILSPEEQATVHEKYIAQQAATEQAKEEMRQAKKAEKEAKKASKD